jgi:hypothetical protein
MQYGSVLGNILKFSIVLNWKLNFNPGKTGEIITQENKVNVIAMYYPN